MRETTVVDSNSTFLKGGVLFERFLSTLVRDGPSLLHLILVPMKNNKDGCRAQSAEVSVFSLLNDPELDALAELGRIEVDLRQHGEDIANGPAHLSALRLPLGPHLMGVCSQQRPCNLLLQWITQAAIGTNLSCKYDDPIVYAERYRQCLICSVIIAGFFLAGAPQ